MKKFNLRNIMLKAWELFRKPAALQKIINGLYKDGYSRTTITTVQSIVKGII